FLMTCTTCVIHLLCLHDALPILQQFAGVYSLQRLPDNNALQLDIQLTPEASAAGINRDQVLSQINQAFYGHTVQRFYDRDDEVEVRTGLLTQERESAWYLENLPIEIAPGTR